MIGFYITNPEVIIARRLERGGRAAPGLDFIRWRLADLRTEVNDDAEFWGIPAADIARSRAEQLAAARAYQSKATYHPTIVEIMGDAEQKPAFASKVGSQ